MTLIYRIVKGLARIESLLTNICFLLKQLKQLQQPEQKAEQETYLHPSEVMRLLKISPSTLYRLKRSKVLVPTAVNGKFYRKSDLINYTSDNPKDPLS
jgi:hypothetical protein